MAAINPELATRIVDSAGDAVIFADREGVIRYWNAAAERIFGYSGDEALGQTLDLIVPEAQRPRHWDGYYRVMETGQTRYGTELLAVPAMRKDGVRISVEFSIALHSENGKTSGASAILRDVSERWQRERAQLSRIKELEAEVAASPQVP
jgi:PAS domain S-box-containing protein